MAVTRKDVADLAGVSTAVVSYVLNGGPRPVSDRARTRVLDAVKELGYRRDGLARSLRVGRTHTLGLVVPDTENPFFAELSRAVEDAAYRLGYAVLVCNSADDVERELTYITSLAERRIDGLVLVSATEDQDLDDIIGLNIPVVALDRSPDASPVSTIRADNETGADLGTTHLIEHGHTRVGFVGGPGTGISDERRAGWARALERHGLDPGPQVRATYNFEGGARAAHELLRSDPTPTAVLVSSDVQAIGLLRGLDDLGRSVPGDVAIVAIDGTRAGEYASPPLTVIAQPIERMGVEAVTHLITEPGTVIHRSLDNRLVVRRSCGCVAVHAT